MLLPKEVTEDGEEEDPRQELVEQLLQYKMYKYMSYELRDRELDGGRTMYKDPTIPEEVMDYVEPVDLDELLGDLTLATLNRVFQDVIRRQEDKIDPVRSKFGKLEKEEVTVEEKRRCHDKKFTHHIEIFPFHGFDIIHILVRNLHNRNIVNIYFIFIDQM